MQRRTSSCDLKFPRRYNDRSKKSQGRRATWHIYWQSILDVHALLPSNGDSVWYTLHMTASHGMFCLLNEKGITLLRRSRVGAQQHIDATTRRIIAGKIIEQEYSISSFLAYRSGRPALSYDVELLREQRA